MRILYITNIPSPYRVDFFNELGKQCELTVIYELKKASDRNSNWKANQANNFKEIYLNAKAVGSDSGISLSIIRYINKDLYDVIVVGGYSTPTAMVAIEYMKIKKIPFVLNTDGGIIKRDKKIKHILKRHYISSANWWLSTGEETSKYLSHYGADLRKIYVYPFTSIFESDVRERLTTNLEKEQLRKEMGINSEKVIISVGQFIHRKGFDVLIQAFAKLPSNYALYIIGGEPTNEYLELVRKLEIKNIFFEDFKNKSDLEKYYSVADIFVLPTREDIWGLVVNEAMANGLPIITTNKCLAGIELVKGRNNGVIVEPNNIKLLTTEIKKVLDNDILREEMGWNSLEIIKGYTIEKMVNIHIKIFNQILEEQK